VSSVRGDRGFRADVEGLRAIAIGGVLLCHAGLRLAPGGYVGVDVFFVISGFLITRMIVDEIASRGSLSLLTFYGNRMKRLLPSLALLLVVVTVLSYVLLSPRSGAIVSGDVIASALYVVNWRFAEQSVDYFATGVEGSPVEHLWSLAVEEQFYLLWPVLLLAVTWRWRGDGVAVRRAALGICALVGLASLVYCVRFTALEPLPAYFSTLTRAWELALGGLVALLPIRRLPSAVAGAVGVAGLVAIGVATVKFSSATPFPGAAALLPTLGAAAVIAAGTACARSVAGRLLALRPLRYVGRISYSWYLWHWPALVFAAAAVGPLSTAQRAAVVAGSWLPAELSHRYVEWPLRRARGLALYPQRALSIGLGCSAVATIAAVALVLSQPSIPVLPADQVPGAAALEHDRDLQGRAEGVRPDPLHPEEDRSRMQNDDCLTKLDRIEIKPCVYGYPSSDTRVVLFGDSLAMQYFPALDRLADRHGWRFTGLAKAGCPPIATPVYNHRLKREYDECEEWRRRALGWIETERPDLVVTTGRLATEAVRDGERLEPAEGEPLLRRGYVHILGRLRATGARVVVIKDLPRSPRNVPDCVSESLDRLRDCAFERTAANSSEVDRAAAAALPGVRLLDPTPLVCPEGLCRAVIGNAVVFRDYDHLTPTFAATLDRWFERRLRPVLE
jgi:peptidoglycan/LPS O-acetylase OafA/YrhL